MPYKDPEARREYNRRRYQANREADNERSRQWRLANPKRHNELNKLSLERNRANRNAYSRQRYRDNHARELSRFFAYRHGPDGERWFAAAWASQAGLCYLCDEPLPADRSKVAVDHDHSCCPEKRSCLACRRGLSCMRCNLMLGRVHDDPDLLEKVAANLRPVLDATRARIRGKPQQLVLDFES